MSHIKKITVWVSGLILLTVLAGVVPVLRRPAAFEAAAQTVGGQDVAPEHHRKILTLDVAVDCRTLVTGPNRGDLFIINGKIFPAGTLPSGTASNDPTQPVNGVAPIGDWLVRGQHAFPFPPAIARSYDSTPGDFATQYYILKGGHTALTAEGYAFLQSQAPTDVLLSVTGGIGGFRGATGDVQAAILGPNATGCPNSRVRVNLVRGR
jgi:hypothetical protein